MAGQGCRCPDRFKSWELGEEPGVGGKERDKPRMVSDFRLSSKGRLGIYPWMGGVEDEPDGVGGEGWILGMWGISSWEMLRRGCSGLGMWGQGLHRKLGQATERGGVTGGDRGGRRRDPRAALEKNSIQGTERRQVNEQCLMPLPAPGPS